MMRLWIQVITRHLESQKSRPVRLLMLLCFALSMFIGLGRLLSSIEPRLPIHGYFESGHHTRVSLQFPLQIRRTKPLTPSELID
jgi:hypothetical protein